MYFRTSFKIFFLNNKSDAMEWNVDTKLSTITLDNCPTNDKLIDIVKDKLQSFHLIKDGAHIHMHCCAHILNLIVKVGLNVIKAPIENVRESISYWTATPKRVEKFEETYPTTNLYFPKVCDIRLKLNEWLVSPTQLVSNMASKMIENFDKYWGAIHELMAVAGVFDPRSKMEMIEFYFPQIYPDDSVSRIKKVRKICEALILEYQEKTLDREYDVWK
ncbi:zinc finger BED domain-containing protein RICESLEEPER 2-like protein [Tanacetum coccineum]